MRKSNLGEKSYPKLGMNIQKIFETTSYSYLVIQGIFSGSNVNSDRSW